MIRYAYRRSVEALCIAALLLSTACSKPADEAVPLSDKEITFQVAESEPMTQSRASLFENGDDLKDGSKGGGNLTLYAHIDGTDKTYISGARAWYFNDANKWVFLNSSNEVMKYYWPNSDALNFFAYMPYKGDQSKETHVTIGPYSEAEGQTFSCKFPLSASYNPTEQDPPAKPVQEFIYAYEEGLTKQNKSVALKFEHPFAAINFKVANESYRMTIKTISFEKIYLAGTFSTAKSAWTLTGNREVFTTNINMRIPSTEGVNYNTIFDEDNPFLVMPQDLEGVKLHLVASRNIDNGIDEIDETFDLSGKWVPGNKYVYTIKVGDNKSEIYFNVAVEEQQEEKDEWIAGGENNIKVE